MSLPQVLRRTPAALLLLPLLAACAAPGGSAAASAASPASAAYDPKIDDAVTAMQLDSDNFLTNIATTPDGTYARFATWYSEFEMKLRALLVRIDARPDGAAAHARVDEAARDLEALREVHKAGALSQDDAQKFRVKLNADWTALLALELARPRG
jgi:polyisoprenoid-binding protein YceI